MKDLYLSVLCERGSGRGLTFHGERSGDELLNGELRAGDDMVGRVVDGIASFVGKPVNWPPDAIEKLKSDGQIARNWSNGIHHAANTPPLGEFCGALAHVDGIVLDVAAGPGGGTMPPVLDRDPLAKIMVNDISLAILQLWQEFLREQGHGAMVCLAAFDARRMPVRTSSIAAVSSTWGVGSIGGTDIFEEMARVLKPGGAVFSVEGVVDPDDWLRMPSDRRSEWEERIPGLTQGIASLVERAGLVIESRQILPGRELEPDEGGLPRDAADHGVTLHIVWEYVVARKL